MEKLSEILKKEAISLGLCKEWTENWGEPDLQGLIDKFLHGIDFCISNGWPTAEFIKKNFPKELLRANNIFVYEDIHSRNLGQMAVLNGSCKGVLLFDGVATCDVYVRDRCDVTIDCSRLSKVFINLYDEAKIRIIQQDAASVYVYTHGDLCNVDFKGDVLIRNS